MDRVFLKILGMSVSAGWLVLAVLLLRLILKKTPKWITILLWGIVAIRLIVPFSIHSNVSLVPEKISNGEIVSTVGEMPVVKTETLTIYNEETDEPLASFIVEEGTMNPPQTVEKTVYPILGWIWATGCCLMMLYTGISYILLRRKVATAVLLEKNIYQSENVDSPFVLGVIKPKIYLPFKMDSQNLSHVIAHEQAHIRRRDHWWKPFGFLLLTLHWFNPLIWVSYIFLCRDIELACDEKVIKGMDRETKADYTQALVACSVHRRAIAACPLAFGEVGVKERVKSVMNYKKPAFWIIIAAVITCIAVAVCFLTDPVEKDEDTDQPGYTLGNITRPWVQEYIPGTDGIQGEVNKAEYLRISQDFAIGADRYGYAVFKDPNKAFYTFKKLYAEGIDAIREQYHLDPITVRDYEFYKVYGWQTNVGSEDAIEQAKFVTRFLDVFENSFEESIPENMLYVDNTIKTDLKTYYQLSDGTWRVDGQRYQHRLEITGRMHNAAVDSTFVYLSNLKSITFDQAWKAAGFSSNTADYFSPDEAVLVDVKLNESVHKLVATVLELDEKTAVVQPVDKELVDKITFSVYDLDEIGAEVGSEVEIQYTGDIMETYPAQIKAIKWELAKDLRHKAYTEQWLDKETAEEYENNVFDHIIITEVYSNCFFAKTVVPTPYVIKLNGTLSGVWCVGDQISCTYENVYYDVEQNRMEVDLLTVEASYWQPEPGMAYKPVIYLYPEEETEVSVRLQLNGNLTCTYPAYNNGWQVTASPDGTLTDAEGKTYNYLYWEGETNARWDMSKGFCVKGEDTAVFLEQALEKLGLNRKEANEFIVYWLPLMEQNPYNIIAFQTDVYTEAAKLNVSPAPDAVIRVFMTWQASESYVNLNAQELTAPDRQGFTVVEWGGTEIK